MIDRLNLYISAAADLAAERDLLGKSIAELPADFGWRITFSPDKNDPLDIDLVYQADFHILMMGTDIRAPVGLEYQQAMLARRKPVTFLKAKVVRTPAANEFVRYVNNFSQWRLFESRPELLQRSLPPIINQILNKAHEYRLTPVEIENLKKKLTELEEASSSGGGEVRGGAGESGLIFSVDRFIPSEGKIIEVEEEPPNNEMQAKSG